MNRTEKDQIVKDRAEVLGVTRSNEQFRPEARVASALEHIAISLSDIRDCVREIEKKLKP